MAGRKLIRTHSHWIASAATNKPTRATGERKDLKRIKPAIPKIDATPTWPEISTNSVLPSIPAGGAREHGRGENYGQHFPYRIVKELPTIR